MEEFHSFSRTAPKVHSSMVLALGHPTGESRHRPATDLQIGLQLQRFPQLLRG